MACRNQAEDETPAAAFARHDASSLAETRACTKAAPPRRFPLTGIGHSSRGIAKKLEEVVAFRVRPGWTGASRPPMTSHVTGKNSRAKPARIVDAEQPRSGRENVDHGMVATAARTWTWTAA